MTVRGWATGIMRQFGMKCGPEVPCGGRAMRAPALLLWSLLGLVVLKLALVSSEEIQAFLLPHDDLWHIRAAGRLYWFGDYSWDTLLHLPVYPLFIELVSWSGLPLRVGTELVYCLGACALVLALWRLGVGTFWALAAALATIFQPASFQTPNRAGAEVLLAALLMWALAGSLTWWSRRGERLGWIQMIATGLWWALAWNVRKESILLAGVLGCFGLCILLADRQEGLRTVGKRMLVGVGAPLFLSLALASGIAAANHARWGLFATSILTAPGYKAAYKALQSIPPQRPLRFISVPVEVRDMAYEASPRFAKLRPYLEGDVGKSWAGISKSSFTDPIGMTGLDEREIANGWFYWALHDAVVAAGYGKTPAQENEYLQKVADQIRKAQKKGLLGYRWVPVAMLEPDGRLWLPGLPGSMRSVAGFLTAPSVLPGMVYDDPGSGPVRELFDQVAHRRKSLTSPSEKNSFDHRGSAAPVPWTKPVQVWWQGIYLAAAGWAAWALVLLVPAWAWMIARGGGLPAYSVAVVLFGSLVAARIAFFALLDATAWPAQPRYLYPVMPVYGALLVLAVATVVQAANEIRLSLLPKFRFISSRS